MPCIFTLCTVTLGNMLPTKQIEPVREKTNNLGSEQVPLKPACTVTEDGWIQKVEELYYPCSENKGAYQLRSYCEADLCLCFRLCRLLVFPCRGSINKILSPKLFTIT